MAVKKNYKFNAFLLSVTVIGMLLLLGLIPSFSLGRLKIKRINILSDIYGTEYVAEADSSQAYNDTTFMAESILASSPERISEAQSTPTGTSQSWNIDQSGAVPLAVEAAVTAIPPAPAAPAPHIDPETYGAPATLVEDFSPAGRNMNAFYSALNHGYAKRPVKIAVLGDSFIEADIITADLREQMQLIYGGQGPGFVPFSSPLAKYRNSVKQTFSGWETYNVLKKKSAPAWVQDRFFVSGNVCIPSEGAWTRVEGTEFRSNLGRCSVARLLFANTKNSTLEVTINDSITSSFTPETSPLIQQINLHGDIRSIKVKITSAAGFVGYGIILESTRGVGVDNYSVRSNSGMALFATNSTVNAQIGKLSGYDLIVLQYGLNAMSPDILNYNAYRAQLVRIVNYVRDCFPGAAIMVMSVGDRSTRSAGEYVTMPAAKAMLAAQRQAAEESGAAFWNTFQAMGGDRSMVKFVENKWASKDYTHIGYQGGKYIATQLVRSLLYGLRDYNGEQLDLGAIPLPDYSVPAPLPLAAPTTMPATAPTTTPAVRPDTLPAPAPVSAPAPAEPSAEPASVPATTPVALPDTQPAPTAPASGRQPEAHDPKIPADSAGKENHPDSLPDADVPRDGGHEPQTPAAEPVTDTLRR